MAVEQHGLRTGGEDRLVLSRKGMRGIQSGWNKEWKVTIEGDIAKKDS